MKTTKFMILPSFYDALECLSEEDQKEMALAILKYGSKQKQPTLKIKTTPHLNAIWILLKPIIDKSISFNNKQIENGKKGGAPIKNTNAKKQPKNNPKTTHGQPKNNREMEGEMEGEMEVESEIKKETNKENQSFFLVEKTNNDESVSLCEEQEKEKKNVAPKRKEKGFDDVDLDFVKSYFKEKRIGILKKSKYFTEQDVIDDWRDYHLSKGTKIKDFKASFRTWVKNAISFGQLGIRKTQREIAIEEGFTPAEDLA